MTKFKKAFSYLFASALLVVVAAQDVPQKKFHGIIIEPAIKSVAISPSETVTGTVRLTNDYQDKPNVKLYPYVMNFRQKGDTGNAELYIAENIDANRDAAKWVTFTESSYSIDYAQTVESNYTIKAPDTAVNGGYYIVLIYSPSDISAGPENVTVGDAIGCLIFLTVRGNNVESTELLEFYSGQSLYDMPPLDMYMRVQNNGNVHATIGGNIFIHQGDITKPVETIEVNSLNQFVLPESIRSYQENINKGFIYFENGQLKIDATKHFYFGQYTATLKLRHMVDNQKVTDEREIKFWVIPWKLILIVILALVIVSFIWNQFKKLIRKIFKRDKVKQ